MCVCVCVCVFIKSNGSCDSSIVEIDIRFIVCSGKCSFVTVVHLAKAQIEFCDLLQTDKYLTDTEQQYALFVLEPENIPSLFVFPRFTSCEIHPDSKDMMGGTFSAKTLGYHC